MRGVTLTDERKLLCWSYLQQSTGSCFSEHGPRPTNTFCLLLSSLKMLQIPAGHHLLKASAAVLLWICRLLLASLKSLNKLMINNLLA